MRLAFVLFLIISSFTFAQIPQEEVDLIKSYKRNLIAKDLDKTTESLLQLIDYYKGNTQYHISLGYIYQLRKDFIKSKSHFEKGKSFIEYQLQNSDLSNEQILEHIVALCFANYDADCNKSYQKFQENLSVDQDLNKYDFETIKKLANHQREIIKNFLIK